MFKRVFVFCLMLLGAHSTYAGGYNIEKITHVYTNANGKIAIKWKGSPNPGPCGSSNYGWVTIEPAADNSLKSFVYTLYVSGLPAVIETTGCDGNSEIVTGIYSPAG